MSTATAQLPPGRSMADHAYATVRERLLTLRIKPGEPLNDEAISAELGCGRTPVREAFKRLEADRLVVTYPRRGTFATAVEISDLAYVSEIRLELEPLAAARAARVLSTSAAAELRVMLRAVESMTAERSTMEELMAFDSSVHRAVYAAASNPHLEDTLVRYNNLSTRIWCLVSDRLPLLAGHIREHAELLRAILAQDQPKAATIARAHVGDFEKAVREALFG